MSEVDEAAKQIAAAVDPDANIIFGATIAENMVDQVKITVVATGFDESKKRLRDMTGKTLYSQPYTQKSSQGQNYPQPGQGQGHSTQLPPVQVTQNGTTVTSPPPQGFNDDDVTPPDEDEFDIPAFLRQK
jgi:cell division protein FtsZ